MSGQELRRQPVTLEGAATDGGEPVEFRGFSTAEWMASDRMVEDHLCS